MTNHSNKENESKTSEHLPSQPFSSFNRLKKQSEPSPRHAKSTLESEKRDQKSNTKLPTFLQKFTKSKSPPSNKNFGWKKSINRRKKSNKGRRKSKGSYSIVPFRRRGKKRGRKIEKSFSRKPFRKRSKRRGPSKKSRSRRKSRMVKSKYLQKRLKELQRQRG